MDSETHNSCRFEGLPGAELVVRGLDDLLQSHESKYVLLLRVAGPRLRALGIDIPAVESAVSFEHTLYAMLEQEYGAAAHSQYNSLRRRIESFARTLAREKYE